MVLKHKKHAVPSGTTFRTGSSAYRQKYLKQATLVKTLKNFPDADAEKKDELCHLHDEIQPGVEYSLNKKGRWNLPEEIRDDLDEDFDHKISLQQFHKIKKKAKCISYEANCGPVKKVVPKKMYFDVGTVEQKRAKNKKTGEVTEVPQAAEVVYSVYWPAGAKSAITYNPKYIDVPEYAHGGDDEHVESSISRKGRTAKNRTRHQIVFTDDDADWSTTDESADEISVDPNDWLEGACASEWGISNDFSGFIDIALQKKEFEKYEKQKKQKSAQETTPETTRKVIYVDRPVMKQKRKEPVQEIQLPTVAESIIVKLNNDSVQETELKNAFEENYAEANVQPRRFVVDVSQQMQDILFTDVACYVVFQEFSDDHNVDKLGYTHFRVWCQSSINIKINQVTKRLNDDVVSVSDVINVICNVIQEADAADVDQKTKRGKKVKRKDVDAKRILQFDASMNQLKTHVVKFTNLNAACGWSVRAESPKRIMDLKSAEEESVRPKSPRASTSHESVCTICYCEADQSNSLTALTSCGHVFCEHCWVTYVTNVLWRASAKVTCPDYECEEEVCSVFIQTLVHVNLYKTYLTRKLDSFLAANEWSWCPNMCGRVLKAETTGSASTDRCINIACDCRTHVCSTCKDESHWPANCTQANNYRAMLKARGDDVRRKYIPPVRVNYVKCPWCFRAVEKVVGCNYIRCICEKAFCWKCGKRWHEHDNENNHYRCYIGTAIESAELNHIPTPKEEEGQSSPHYIQAVHHHHHLMMDNRRRTDQKFTAVVDKALNAVRKSAPNKFGYSCQVVQDAKVEMTEVKNAAREVLFELHHLAEYTNVALLFNRKNRSLLPCPTAITQSLDKLNFTTVRFHQLLESEERPACEIIEQLRHYTTVGQTCIVRQVAALRFNGLPE